MNNGLFPSFTKLWVQWILRNDKNIEYLETWSMLENVSGWTRGHRMNKLRNGTWWPFITKLVPSTAPIFRYIKKGVKKKIINEAFHAVHIGRETFLKAVLGLDSVFVETFCRMYRKSLNHFRYFHYCRALSSIIQSVWLCLIIWSTFLLSTFCTNSFPFLNYTPYALYAEQGLDNFAICF